MDDLKMTGGDNANYTKIAEFIKEESVINSFYVEGVVGIFICTFVVVAIIAMILYYVLPCRK